MTDSTDKKNAAREIVQNALALGISAQDLIDAAQESMRVIQPISDATAKGAKEAAVVVEKPALVPTEPAIASGSPALQEKSIDTAKEALIKSILEDGGFKLSMAFDRSGYGTRGHRVDITDKYGARAMSLVEELRRNKNKSRESIFINPIPGVKIMESVTIPGKKGGLFGIGKTPDTYEHQYKGSRPVLHSEVVEHGKSEPCTIVTYCVDPYLSDWAGPDGRRGQFLILDMRLPVSIVEQIQRMVEMDPKFIRTVVENIMVTSFNVPKKFTDGQSCTPPFWKSDKPAKMLIWDARTQKESIIDV